MGSKKHNKPYFVIGVLLVTVALLCFTKSHSSGLYMKASGDNYKTEDNLDNIKKRVSFEVDIPEYIKNLDNKNLQCEILMRQIVTANTDKYVLKIMKYVADDADPLALYENSKTDKKYSIKQKDSKIHYFRYRQGYDKFPSCTLINWNTDETAYGFMIEDNMSEADALEMLNID